VINKRTSVFWLSGTCGLLISQLAWSDPQVGNNEETPGCGFRASERHRQGQSLACKNDSHQTAGIESTSEQLTPARKKCQKRASERHRQAQSLRCKNG
jgi:hypothetical protein